MIDKGGSRDRGTKGPRRDKERKDEQTRAPSSQQIYARYRLDREGMKKAR